MSSSNNNNTPIHCKFISFLQIAYENFIVLCLGVKKRKLTKKIENYSIIEGIIINFGLIECNSVLCQSTQVVLHILRGQLLFAFQFYQQRFSPFFLLFLLLLLLLFLFLLFCFFAWFLCPGFSFSVFDVLF